MDRVKRIWYLSPMRAAKVQASLRIRAVSPEPSLLAHTSTESRGTFRQKTRSLAPLNGWACAVEICHDGMLEDTNSLDGAHNIPGHNTLFAYFLHSGRKKNVIKRVLTSPTILILTLCTLWAEPPLSWEQTGLILIHHLVDVTCGQEFNILEKSFKI